VPKKSPRLLLITSDWPPPGKVIKRSAELLQAAGMSVEVFAFRGRNLYNYAAAWTQLRPRLHPGRYDVVHAQDASNALLAFPKRVPLVLTFVGVDSRLPHRLAARFLVRRADAVVVESDEMRGRVPTRAPVHVIPLGLDETTRADRLVAIYRSVVKG